MPSNSNEWQTRVYLIFNFLLLLSYTATHLTVFYDNRVNIKKKNRQDLKFIRLG